MDCGSHFSRYTYDTNTMFSRYTYDVQLDILRNACHTESSHASETATLSNANSSVLLAQINMKSARQRASTEPHIMEWGADRCLLRYQTMLCTGRRLHRKIHHRLLYQGLGRHILKASSNTGGKLPSNQPRWLE
jgi:hypothetical protein